MNYDLFLTRTGDFSFLTVDPDTKQEKFEFQFHVAQSDSLLFNFNVVNNESIQLNANQLVFNFYIYEPKYDKSAKTVSNYDFANQAIKLRIGTELGSVVKNETLGSNIFELMHVNIPDDKLKVKIQDLVKNAISDIMPDATIDVHFLNTDYLNYHDSIRIVIINNEELYYYTI